MYKIDKANNNINKIKEESFSNLKYRERDNLQERIAKNPDIFGEDLLIIQKEFDGFNDTRERLDLLALDKEGNIVIIENKLDDTGRDVVRQSLKYASYCSTLTKKEVIDVFQSYLDKQSSKKIAQKELEEFYEVDDIEEIEFNTLQSQRIILVAGNFRKEVTSTALWLMSYGLNVQCFKATIFAQNNDHFLNIEQIIPIQDAEEFTIKVAEKQKEIVQTQVSQTRKGKLHKEFWTKLLEKANKLSPLYANITPTDDHWLCAGSGMGGVVYSYVTTKRYCRVELYPSRRKNFHENKEIFNYLYTHKTEIEQSFGKKLERDDGGIKKYTRISYELPGVSIENNEDHEDMIEFLSINMKKLYEAMDPYLKKIKDKY